MQNNSVHPVDLMPPMEDIMQNVQIIRGNSCVMTKQSSLGIEKHHSRSFTSPMPKRKLTLDGRRGSSASLKYKSRSLSSASASSCRSNNDDELLEQQIRTEVETKLRDSPRRSNSRRVSFPQESPSLKNGRSIEGIIDSLGDSVGELHSTAKPRKLSSSMPTPSPLLTNMVLKSIPSSTNGTVLFDCSSPAVIHRARSRKFSNNNSYIALDRVFQCKVALDIFTVYCAYRSCEENLLFWQDVEQFQNFGWKAAQFFGIAPVPNSKTTLKKEAHRIYDTYLSDSATTQVFVDYSIHNDIKDALSSDRITKRLFREAQKAIFADMEANIFEEFVQSLTEDQYRQLCQIMRSQYKKTSPRGCPQIATALCFEAIGKRKIAPSPSDSK